jgi:PAS domain S-box-containing protein
MPVAPPPSPTSRLSLIKEFSRIFLMLCGVLAIVASMHYYSFYSTERATRRASEELNVDLARRMITTDISSVVRDLGFLAEHIERRELFEQPSGLRKRRIEREFLVFSEKKALYDQIRFLDKTGMEIVRINYRDGQPMAVTRRNLQNKASRYYFRETLELERGGVYISPLDLNVEKGHIEEPYKPMMRFGTPVFDRYGVKQGVVILNYFGARLIQNFTNAAANISDQIELVNSDGYWLRTPRKEDEWGFMFGNDQTFGKHHQKEWERIKAAEKGQFQAGSDFFTFQTLYPTRIAHLASDPWLIDIDEEISDIHGPYWKIIARVSPRELAAGLSLFTQRHWALYLAILGLSGLGAWLLTITQTKHRQAEAQGEYERRFRHTLENIELAAVALDRNGRVTFCNDYFLSLTGWQRKQVVGQNWLEHFIPEGKRHEMRELLDCMDTPATFPTHYENQVTTKDNSLRLIAWNNTLSYDAQGRAIGITGIGEDVTEQRITEVTLRKLSRAVEQSPATVMITDRNGHIEYTNPKFTQVTGYQQEEIIGLNPRILKSGETTPEEYANLWNTIISGGEWRGELHNRKKNGELFWESASISPIRNQLGEITNFLAVKEDITERKRLEQEVDIRNRELARNQALAAMGRMASMVAHDLRNPLSSVKMTLQILGKRTGEKTNEEVHELRQIALEQIRYMEDILSDMLTYSRPDAIKPEWITVDKMIDIAISLTQRKLDELGVEVVTQYQPGLPTLHGDATKLRQVISNLITNAAQAAQDNNDNPNSRVEIDAMMHLGPEGTGIRIEICDNGRGINAEDQERLFEPFFTTRAKGTGLGLAIVKRILDQHNASISLQPHQPQGTCAVVVLPTAPQNITEPEQTGSERTSNE